MTEETTLYPDGIASDEEHITDEMIVESIYDSAVKLLDEIVDLELSKELSEEGVKEIVGLSCELVNAINHEAGRMAKNVLIIKS